MGIVRFVSQNRSTVSRIACKELCERKATLRILLERLVVASRKTAFKSVTLYIFEDTEAQTCGRRGCRL